MYLRTISMTPTAILCEVLSNAKLFLCHRVRCEYRGLEHWRPCISARPSRVRRRSYDSNIVFAAASHEGTARRGSHNVFFDHNVWFYRTVHADHAGKKRGRRTPLPTAHGSDLDHRLALTKRHVALARQRLRRDLLTASEVNACSFKWFADIPQAHRTWRTKGARRLESRRRLR